MMLIIITLNTDNGIVNLRVFFKKSNNGFPFPFQMTFHLKIFNCQTVRQSPLTTSGVHCPCHFLWRICQHEHTKKSNCKEPPTIYIPPDKFPGEGSSQITSLIMPAEYLLLLANNGEIQYLDMLRRSTSCPIHRCF